MAFTPPRSIAPGARLDPTVRGRALRGHRAQGRDRPGHHGGTARGRSRAGPRIGAGNRIFQFASVGAQPQDLKYAGEDTELHLGDQNLVREFTTLHIGTTGRRGVTRIGSRNLFMAYAHVAHDCQVGNGCVLANARHPRRARRDRRPRHPRRAVGGAPVHPGGAARLRRRRVDGGDGRAAVLHRAGRPGGAGGRQQRGPRPARLQRGADRPGSRRPTGSSSGASCRSTRPWAAAAELGGHSEVDDLMLLRRRQQARC